MDLTHRAAPRLPKADTVNDVSLRDELFYAAFLLICGIGVGILITYWFLPFP